ncbi:hypothetical protein L3X38_003687 [Prunus dulcis]|uniref:Uncharacterized protein n=1 Tax=Prunus dulcis TaxID=3755 RepID=A0AAD4ZMK7_PRUDU|nr:hypothetical protein L3X38_003687 [Prunus dulcis]
MRVSSSPTQNLWLHDMNSYVHLHHFSISTNPCSPKSSSFSCSMPRPPNRNRRTRGNRNPSRPTTTITTTTTKPYFYPSSSPSRPDTLQATFDLQYLYHTSHYSLQQFLSSSSDALQDLRTPRLRFWGRSGYGREGTVVRRDRSLGGKEVVVGRVEKDRVDVRKKEEFWDVGQSSVDAEENGGGCRVRWWIRIIIKAKQIDWLERSRTIE